MKQKSAQSPSKRTSSNRGGRVDDASESRENAEKAAKRLRSKINQLGIGDAARYDGEVPSTNS